MTGRRLGYTTRRPPARALFDISHLRPPLTSPLRFRDDGMSAMRSTRQGKRISDFMSNRRAVITGLWWLVWLVYAGAWTLALLTPQPVHVRDAIMSAGPAEYISKLLHIGAYLGFAVLTGLLRVRTPYRWLMLVVLSAHAVATEYLQQFVPYRTPALEDIAYDHAGIVLGFLISWKWWFARAAAPERPL